MDDLPHTLEAIKTMRLLATLTDQIEDPRWETKEEYQSFSNFSVEGISNISTSASTWLNPSKKNTSSLKPYGLKVFNLSPSYIFEIPFEVAKLSKTSLISNVDFQVI